jgi:adenylate kinase
MSHHRIVMLGAPGSGKGTIAGHMSQQLGVPTVSTGQMFREAIKAGGTVGVQVKSFVESGGLVPDEIVVEVVRLWMQNNQGGGFICDGFPRTVAQAEAFDKILKELGKPLTMAVLLDVTEEEILERILGRLVCENCGALYHETRMVPKVAGSCDKCGGKLVERGDDTEATVRERLRVYEKTTTPVISYYEKTGVLQRVNGNGLAETACAAVMVLFQK